MPDGFAEREEASGVGEGEGGRQAAKAVNANRRKGKLISSSG